MADAEPKAGNDDPRIRGKLVAQANDTTALNGGVARHWYRRGEREALPTPRRNAKLISAIFVWGTVLITVLLLLAELS